MRSIPNNKYELLDLLMAAEQRIKEQDRLIKNQAAQIKSLKETLNNRY